MHNRKPYKIIDRKREIKKGVMAESLEELISRGKIFFYQKKALLQKRNEIFLGIFQYYYEISFLNKMYFVYNFEYHYIPMTTKTNWYRKLKAQKEISYILLKIIQKEICSLITLYHVMNAIFHTVYFLMRKDLSFHFCCSRILKMVFLCCCGKIWHLLVTLNPYVNNIFQQVPQNVVYLKKRCKL